MNDLTEKHTAEHFKVLYCDSILQIEFSFVGRCNRESVLLKEHLTVKKAH